MTTQNAYGTTPSAFQLSNTSDEDGSTSVKSLQGFHSATNGYLPTAGSSTGPYNALHLQSPWATSRMSMDAYSSLDACKFLHHFVSYLHHTRTSSYHVLEIWLERREELVQLDKKFTENLVIWLSLIHI